MRVPPMFVVIAAIVAGYFVSVPLFGHLYGILPDGTTTHILREEDVENCKAQLIKSNEPAPPIANEPQELLSQDIQQAEPACDLRPPEALALDWLYLPRTLASHSARGKETSLLVDAIGGVLTSKTTWEIATGAALTGSLFFLLEFFASFTRRHWHGQHIGWGSRLWWRDRGHHQA